MRKSSAFRPLLSLALTSLLVAACAQSQDGSVAEIDSAVSAPNDQRLSHEVAAQLATHLKAVSGMLSQERQRVAEILKGHFGAAAEAADGIARALAKLFGDRVYDPDHADHVAFRLPELELSQDAIVAADHARDEAIASVTELVATAFQSPHPIPRAEVVRRARAVAAAVQEIVDADPSAIEPVILRAVASHLLQLINPDSEQTGLKEVPPTMVFQWFVRALDE